MRARARVRARMCAAPVSGAGGAGRYSFPRVCTAHIAVRVMNGATGRLVRVPTVQAVWTTGPTHEGRRLSHLCDMTTDCSYVFLWCLWWRFS